VREGDESRVQEELGTEGKKEEGKRIGEVFLSWQSVYLGKSHKPADLRLFLSRGKVLVYEALRY